MYVSKELDFGFRTMIVLASCQKILLTAKDISSRFRIPHNFLSLILPKLVRAGLATLVKEDKQKKEFYKLAKSPETVTLLDISRAIEGPFELIALNDKNREDVKEFHSMMDVWTGLKSTIEEYLSQIHLDQYIIAIKTDESAQKNAPIK